MSEPTPDAAPPVTETELAPITNGTATTEAADVMMADSTDTPVNQEVLQPTFLNFPS